MKRVLETFRYIGTEFEEGYVRGARSRKRELFGSRWIRRSALVRLRTMDSIIVIGAA